MRRDRTTLLRLLPLLAALLLLPAGAGAQGGGEAPTVDASELPDPDLTGLEEAVASQLTQMRDWVVRQMTETETPPAKLPPPSGWAWGPH